MSLSKSIETPTTSGEASGMTILELPFDIFANILLKYFTYDEISGLRLVSVNKVIGLEKVKSLTYLSPSTSGLSRIQHCLWRDVKSRL